MAKSVRGGDNLELNLANSGSLTWPASVGANDIAYVFVCFYQPSNTAAGTPSGFSVLAAETGIDAGGGTGAGSSVIQGFYKQCAGTESGDLTVSFSGVNVYANAILVVMAGDGDLTHASVGSITTAQSTTDSTASAVSATSGQLLMGFYGVSDPPGTTNAAPSGMTLAQDGVNTTNSVRVYWQSITSTASTGNKTWDFTSSRSVGAFLALADDAGAGGGGSANGAAFHYFQQQG